MALGATTSAVRRMAVGRGLAIAAAGISVGLAGALAANKLLTSLLYHVSPTDGGTLVTVSALLLVAAGAATALPARASTRVVPVIALRPDA